MSKTYQTMKIKTRNGNTLTFDPSKWMISSKTECRIIDKSNGIITLENADGLRVAITDAIFTDNHINTSGESVDLGQTLYDYYIRKPERERINERFNTLFFKNIDLVFQNMELILTKAEYYMLTPQLCKSGGLWLGEFSYTLGSLVDSILHNKKHPMYTDIGKYKQLYLIHLTGSPLSGAKSSWLWSVDQQKVISFPSNSKINIPGPFTDPYKKLKKAVESPVIELDHQDRILQMLLAEIKG